MQSKVNMQCHQSKQHLYFSFSTKNSLARYLSLVYTMLMQGHSPMFLEYDLDICIIEKRRIGLLHLNLCLDQPTCDTG